MIKRREYAKGSGTEREKERKRKTEREREREKTRESELVRVHSCAIDGRRRENVKPLRIRRRTRERYKMLDGEEKN